MWNVINETSRPLRVDYSIYSQKQFFGDLKVVKIFLWKLEYHVHMYTLDITIPSGFLPDKHFQFHGELNL